MKKTVEVPAAKKGRPKKDCHSRAEARQSIFEYIEVFYNRQRRHTFLDYLTPVDYEAKYAGN